MSEYQNLSREDLERRLRRAEDVCLMFGWAGWSDPTPRGRATLELWRAWADHPGVSLSDRPDLLAVEDNDYALRHLRDSWPQEGD